MNFLIKIFEICIVTIIKKIFDKFEFSSKFTRYLIKIIAWILSVCLTAFIAVIFLLLTFNAYKSISVNSAEKEIARKMENAIIQCFSQEDANVKHSTPNFMTWSRIQQENGFYKLDFIEVLGDIDGSGVVTDILRKRLNPPMYNTKQDLDDETMKLFRSLPEFTPFGLLTSDVDGIRKNGKMNIIIPIAVSIDIESKLHIKTYEYNGEFRYFEYNPTFFTKRIIPNLGLKKNTGYQDTKLDIVWVIVTKSNSNVIYAFSWSFTNEDKCRVPNGSVAKTQTLIELAQYAKQEAREKLFFNLF